MRFVLLILPMMVFCFSAHAQEAPNAVPAIELPNAFAPGTVSRFQRQVIEIKDTDNPNASPASRYFDDVMDHLEMLMADQIRKNNEIAALQEKVPGYRF